MWRNGSALDSKSKGCEFNSRRSHNFLYQIFLENLSIHVEKVKSKKESDNRYDIRNINDIFIRITKLLEVPSEEELKKFDIEDVLPSFNFYDYPDDDLTPPKRMKKDDIGGGAEDNIQINSPPTKEMSDISGVLEFED